MYAIKRKERVVVAVRRIARERLDRVLSELDGGSEASFEDGIAQRSQDLRRTLSVLSVVGKAMDAEALRRERSALRRVWRSWEAATPSGKRLLRQRSALAEVRMRAGYWHVEGEGFDVLRPGLRSMYGKARRLVRNAAEATTLESTEREALRAACLVWGDVLRLVERAWPEVLSAERDRMQKLCKALAVDAESEMGAEVGAAEALDAVRRASAWMSETPGRWTDRCAGYWWAWRGDERG